MIIFLKEEKFEDLVNEGNVLVDFYADWCGPCQSLTGELEELSKENEDLKIVKVNVDENEDLAIEKKVMSIPALFLYKNGELVKKHVGYMDKSELISWIK